MDRALAAQDRIELLAVRGGDSPQPGRPEHRLDDLDRVLDLLLPGHALVSEFGAPLQVRDQPHQRVPDYPYARGLLESVTQGSGGKVDTEYVLNDLLEIFGEVTTVAFGNE